MDWDDLKVFLAVARGESLSRAGKVLKLDAATAGRRVQRLEQAVGLRLFTRSPQGYLLTDEGGRLVAHAEAVEAEMARARDALAGPVEGMSGQIRIGAPRETDLDAGHRRISARQGICQRRVRAESRLDRVSGDRAALPGRPSHGRR